MQEVEDVPCESERAVTFVVCINAAGMLCMSADVMQYGTFHYCKLAWPVELVNGPTQCIFGILHKPSTTCRM